MLSAFYEIFGRLPQRLSRQPAPGGFLLEWAGLTTHPAAWAPSLPKKFLWILSSTSLILRPSNLRSFFTTSPFGDPGLDEFVELA
jgi:hypothetical protein